MPKDWQRRKNMSDMKRKNQHKRERSRLPEVADEKDGNNEGGSRRRQRLPKRKKILFAYITHRMPVTEAKTDRNVRHQIKNRASKTAAENSRQQNRLRQ